MNYVHVPTDLVPETPDTGKPFTCLLLVERATPPEYREKVAYALIDADCRHTVSWGHEVSKWHDAIDEMYLEYYYSFHSGWPAKLASGQDIPDDKFVLTSALADETLENALEYAAHFQRDGLPRTYSLLVLDFSFKHRGGDIQRMLEVM